MEQFFVVPTFVYNNNINLNTQIVIRQEHPKYLTEPNPTYQYDSLKMK